MKSVINLFSVVVVFSIAFSACSKKDNPTPALAADGTLIATLDGTAFKSTTAAAAIVGGTTTITAVDASDETITISINTTVAGTFAIKGSSGTIPDAVVALTPDRDNWEETYVSTYYDATATVGSVVITEIDATAKTITGTFVAKVKKLVPAETEINITLGSFTKIPYTTSTTGTNSNAFSLKLDGVAQTGFDFIDGAASSGTVIMTATSGQSTYGIIVPANATVGTHDFGTIGSDYYATITSGGSGENFLISTSGTITISKFDAAKKEIEATFSYQADRLEGGNAVSVTEGALAITWQ